MVGEAVLMVPLWWKIIFKALSLVRIDTINVISISGTDGLMASLGSCIELVTAGVQLLSELASPLSQEPSKYVR